MTQLRTRAVRALKWSWIQAGFGSLLQLGITATLARLLVPSDFGIVALATVTVRFLSYFSQMGFGVAIVQRESLEPSEVSQLATLSVCVGAAFACIGFLASFVIGGEVGDVLRVLSVSFIVVGLSVVPYGLLRRELRYRQIAVVELVAQILGNGIVAVVLATLGAGPWSIVIGLLVQQFTVTIGVRIAVRAAYPSLSFGAPTRGVMSFLRFGLLHSLNTFSEFIFYNAEVIVIGKWLGVQQTGYYNRAFSLSHLPIEQVMTSVVRVLFPVLSRLRGEGEKERATFLTTFVLGGVFCSGFCAAMFVAAPEIANVVFGPRWSSTIPLLQVFSIVIPVRYLLNLQSAWLDARAALGVRTRVVFACIVMKACLISAAIYLERSFVEVVLAAILADYVWQLLYIWVVPAATSLQRRKLVYAYVVFALNAAFVALTVHLVTTMAVQRLSEPAVLALQVCTGGLSVAVSILVTARFRVLAVRADLLAAFPVVGKLLSRLTRAA